MTTYIADAVRTPVGRLRGSLSAVRPDDLLAGTLQGLLARHPEMPAHAVDDIIMGCANQAGEDNRNIARMAALLAGFPVKVPGVTTNRLCGSGMQAVADGYARITAGVEQLLIAGGVESMSRAPYVLPKPEKAFPRDLQLTDTALGWRLMNPRLAEQYQPLAMGETAEVVAEKYGISREAQDAFALHSHQRYFRALASSRFLAQLLPVQVPQSNATPLLVQTDEAPRADTSLEKLARLQPAFRKGGTVTAGNAAGLNDGAAALLLASEQGLKAHGLTPLARIASYAVAGVHPDEMGIGPVPASRLALKRAGLTIGQLELVELNEAFAAQALACMQQLQLDPEKVNVNGGAIAIGHPLGSSGARILTSLAYELAAQKKRYGLATMCIGVGQGIAMIIENLHL